MLQETTYRSALRKYHSKRVFVADDDRDLRTLFSHTLTKGGYEVTTFANGSELLEHVGSAMLDSQHYRYPDVIVIDVCMPDYSGLEILRNLRQSDPLLPFIVITAKTDREVRDLAERFGAAAFLLKPFGMPGFLDVLRATLGVSP